MFQDRVDNATDGGHDYKKNQVCQHHGVHLAFDLTTLTWCAARVENELGIKTGVHDNADDPSGVPKYRTAQQCRLQINRISLIADRDCGSKLVHQNLRAVAFNPESILCVGTRRGIAEVGERRDGVARLEIGLAVQIFGLDEGNILVLARCADEYVGRDALMVENLDKVADAQVFPGGALPVRFGIGGTIVVIFGIYAVTGGRGGRLLKSFGWSTVGERLIGLCKLFFADALG